MKSILISIKPAWVAKILNGEKTIEIRKTAPKCDLPIDVYIYCTKGGALYVMRDMLKDNCYKATYGERKHKTAYKYDLSGHIVAKFTLTRIDDIGKYAYAFKDEFFYETLKDACLTTRDLAKYAPVSRLEWEKKGMKLYAWRISDLQIFDEPKELDEFDYPNPSGTRYVGKRSLNGLPSKKHPPQSWCYVEEEE